MIPGEIGRGLFVIADNQDLALFGGKLKRRFYGRRSAAGFNDIGKRTIQDLMGRFHSVFAEMMIVKSPFSAKFLRQSQPVFPSANERNVADTCPLQQNCHQQTDRAIAHN